MLIRSFITDDDKKSSWIFVKKPKKNEECEMKNANFDFKGKSVEEIIKTLFLVDMPNCFYSFYDFCKSIDCSNPLNVFKPFGLQLVGPFDVLNGK